MDKGLWGPQLTSWLRPTVQRLVGDPRDSSVTEHIVSHILSDCHVSRFYEIIQGKEPWDEFYRYCVGLKVVIEESSKALKLKLGKKEEDGHQ